MTSATSPLDPRINAFRPDLADEALRPFVSAQRYVEGKPRQCIHGVVPLLSKPDVHAARASEIRYGEFLDVFETRKDGFVWVQNRTDRRVGYAPSAEGFAESISSLTNRVTALHTFVYLEPDRRAPLVDRLTLGSYVSIMRRVDAFVELASGGFVFAGHVRSSSDSEVDDYVFTAGRMLGVPYLHGGRTPLGLDDAGLVQLVLEMAGFEVPRDSDLQRQAFGVPCKGEKFRAILRRGQIVFFQPDHVGIMTAPDYVLHADETAMQVMAEPLENVLTRGYEIIAAGIPTK